MQDTAAEPLAAARPSPLPAVTVIMTALDEARHLREAVESVFAQDYRGRLELVVAVGPSADDTRALADDLAREHDGRMTVVDNPTGRTPAGLNIAIAAVDPASSVVVRTDGHAYLPADYVSTAVEVLRETGAANVGGMMVPEGTTDFERAVARAMSSPIGIGSVPFHVGGEAGPAETVYLGVFTRDVLRRTGGFDEHFTRAQDWELNHRIRDLGETVWFSPRLQVTYRPRPNLRRLATQFRGSGRWRWQIVRAYPETTSVRYLAAPVTTAALAAAAVSFVLGGRVVKRLAALPLLGYPALVLGGAVATRDSLPPGALARYPAVLATMHLSWGSGFLAGVLSDVRARLRSLRGGR